jgi:hypothetical protein
MTSLIYYGKYGVMPLDMTLEIELRKMHRSEQRSFSLVNEATAPNSFLKNKASL